MHNWCFDFRSLSFNRSKYKVWSHLRCICVLSGQRYALTKQMGGRSCRTRGACYCTYFLNTDEDKGQVRLRFTKTIASELNSTVELT